MLKSVEIVLENCEVYQFKPENVYTILRNIGKTVDGISTRLTVEEVAIYIKKNAKAEHEDWQGAWDERINRDITQIHFNYENYSDCYFVSWADGSDYENAYEKDFDRPFDKVFVISANPEAHKRYIDDES